MKKDRKKKITTIIVKKKLRKKFSLKEFVKSMYKIMLKENLQQITWEEPGKFKIILRRKSEPVEIYKRSEEKKSNDLNYIKAPMNGIFYITSSPGTEPFVKVNDEITAGDTVCIIEAMKLMNEVQVEHSCRIVKILTDNGAPVKVNQPIFEIEYL